MEKKQLVKKTLALLLALFTVFTSGVFAAPYEALNESIVLSETVREEKKGADYYEIIVREEIDAPNVLEVSGNNSASFSLSNYEDNFGEQLDDFSKEIYDALVNHYIINKRTSNMKYEFSSPILFEFDQNYYNSNGLNGMESYETAKEIISWHTASAYIAFSYDYPIMFWQYGCIYEYPITFTGSEGKIPSLTFLVEEEYEMSIMNIPIVENLYKESLTQIKSKLSETSTREEILKTIHDYICENATYYTLDTSESFAHSIEGFFMYEGSVVCEGYAKTLKLFADEFNIPNVLVAGDAGGGHMWNYVQMEDGKWYLIDATWDDQKTLTHTYFLANKNTLGFDNIPISEEREEWPDLAMNKTVFTYPYLSDTAYISHVHSFTSSVVEPTCGENGYTSHTCSCGVSYNDNETTATGSHSGGTATCSELAICDICDKQYGDYDENNHINTKIKNAVSATCKSTGYSGDTYCADCNTELSAGRVIGKTSHTTPDSQGKCSYCKKILTVGTIENLKAEYTSSYVKFTWNKAKNASGYRIFHRVNGKWKNIATIKDCAIVIEGLTTGTKYQFAIRAFNNTDEVLWSDYHVTVSFTTAAAKPAKIVTSQNASAIKLTWSKSTGATGYRIYYRTSTKNSWSIAKKATAKTTHTFTNLPSGKSYQFAVRPYIIDNGKVIWSDYTTIFASTLPANPTVKVSSPSKGKLTVKWNAVSGAKGYQVYYKVGNGNYKLYKIYSKAGTLNFSSLKSGYKYTFAVRAYKKLNGVTYRSGYKAVSATVK